MAARVLCGIAGSMDRLPIDDILPDLRKAVSGTGHAVLQAPPGAGKTTRVPLALLDIVEGRVLVLEPRRLATRAAAERMASNLGEPVGLRVGYRMRGETKVSNGTRIEVITEGILTRMIQSDPSLEGVGAVVFDEFHERSLNADLGLALCLEIRSALREDLCLIVMSATLDAEPVARLMGDAPLITSEGRAYPVETVWLDRPKPKTLRFENAISRLISHAHEQTDGSILAFLPGESEIRRVAALLDLSSPVFPLYGALPYAEQRRAIKPSPQRKIVLATSIAETSLTIPDIRLVVDGGLTRRARFDPGSGMSRLVTDRVSRAEAEQRRGRAGRVAAGTCYRLWTKGEEGAMTSHPPAEIEATDLTTLALELSEWGTDSLPFLTPPPEASLENARRLLGRLSAIVQGRITDHGRKIARIPLHPRLAHMLCLAGKRACMLAALLNAQDPMRGAGADLSIRLSALKSGDSNRKFQDLRSEAKRLERFAEQRAPGPPAEDAALAYPDRIALRRPGAAPRWLMSGGKGVRMDEADPLANERLLVVTDTDGHPTEATIRTCVPISEASLREVFQDQIEEIKSTEWSRREGRVIAVVEDKLGAIALSSRRWNDAPDEAIAAAMLTGIREIGFGFSDAAERFRARVRLVAATGANMPDMDDGSLMETLEDWLLPHLGATRSASDWKRFDALPALRAMLDWDQMQRLDRDAPAGYTTPLGRTISIDYSSEIPEISLRLQEMFGTTRHPSVAGRPLKVTLLSPAGRPLQTTMDIPGFWATSYDDVRKDMRGRYPKHPWPEDPTIADPTLRAKRKS